MDYVYVIVHIYEFYEEWLMSSAEGAINFKVFF